MPAASSSALDLPPMPESASWPRLMTGPHPRAVGTYGRSIAEWALEHPTMHPRRLEAVRWFQELALIRAFEHDDAGELVWRTVLFSGPRQIGKSYLERMVCAWRIHAAAQFGGPQDVLHVAHKLIAAQEVWRPGARWALERYGKRSVRWANGEQQIECPDGSRWMVQAATDGAGVAFALSMVLADEAWRINRSVVDAALLPTMAEAQEPQLWLVSTAGTSDSELMSGYRALALALEAPGPDDSILLLEWSAPPDPDLDLDDPSVWRSASPYWDSRREQRVRDARATVTELEFRHQWLNQWVATLSAPMFDPAAWPMCRWLELLPTGPVALGVDVAADRSAAWIVAESQGVVEVIDTRPGVSWVGPRVLELVSKWRPVAVGIDGTGPAATVADQLWPELEVAPLLVVLNGKQMATACGAVYDAIIEGRFWARAHEDLDAAVSGATRRSVGQSWVFNRQVGDRSSSPLIAATVANWAATHAPAGIEESTIW